MVRLRKNNNFKPSPINEDGKKKKLRNLLNRFKITLILKKFKYHILKSFLTHNLWILFLKNHFQKKQYRQQLKQISLIPFELLYIRFHEEVKQLTIYFLI